MFFLVLLIFFLCYKYYTLAVGSSTVNTLSKNNSTIYTSLKMDSEFQELGIARRSILLDQDTDVSNSTSEYFPSSPR